MAEAASITEVQPIGDEDDRKLFVGGLPQDATQVSLDCSSIHTDLYELFKRFG